MTADSPPGLVPPFIAFVMVFVFPFRFVEGNDGVVAVVVVADAEALVVL